jgi:hypothetical protein
MNTFYRFVVDYQDGFNAIVGEIFLLPMRWPVALGS